MEDKINITSSENVLKIPEIEISGEKCHWDSDTPDSPTFISDLLKEKNYKMNHPYRGKAIIFNHEYYENNCNDVRKGTNEDVKNLVFALHKLGFNESEIEIYHDLTFSKIYETLKEVREEDHSKRDLLMVFVLTHGDPDDLMWAYDLPYPAHILWNSFTGDKCLTLAGKPKLFFIVACRGLLKDEGIQRQASKTEVDATVIEKPITHVIPKWSDIMCIYSTYKGYCSFRDPMEGTWYVQAFCEELSEIPDIGKISFNDFLTGVNGRIAKLPIECNTGKQIPMIVSTLTKNLYFEKKKLLSTHSK